MNEISIQDRYRLYGMLIKDDIRFMIEKAIKRLPVMDVESRLKDMNSRDSLLRNNSFAASEI